MSKDKVPFHHVVAQNLIEQLEKGTAPWQRPWQPGEMGAGIPYNASTGKRYKGINAIHLMVQGRADQRWMTYNQAKAAGAQVRKGEKGTPCQKWIFNEETVKRDEQGRPVLDDQGKPVKVTVALERPILTMFTVFNAEQIDGLPPLQRKDQTWDASERAEKILAAAGVELRHQAGGGAFYRPSTDTVHLPDKSQFQTAANYYATALHELGHWTGHPSRLDRDLSGPFGSESYAREELRAEIASMITGAELDIGHDPHQHAAYVGSWIKVLKEDPLEIFRAAADAEKIHSYVMAFEQKQEQERENQIGATSAQAQNTQGQSMPGQVQQTAAGVEPSQVQETAPRDRLEWEEAVYFMIEEQYSVTRSDAQAIVDAQADRLESAWWDGLSPERAVAAVMGDEKPEQTAGGGQRIDLEVPFKDKNDAKALGARWDRSQRVWYVPEGVDATPFQKWVSKAAMEHSAVSERGESRGAAGYAPSAAPQAERIYLAVPYGERDLAKRHGALWDKAAGSWYVGPQGDAEKLARWQVDDRKDTQGPRPTPQEELRDALRSMGAVIDGGGDKRGQVHPIMDGKWHRVPSQSDKKGESSIGYFAHDDERPAGFIIDHRTGIQVKWVAKGNNLSEEEKAQLAAVAAEKQKARAAETQAEQEATRQRVFKQVSQAKAVQTPTPYLEAKGLGVHAGIFTDAKGTTLIPAYDVDGKLWTMQYVSPEGTKRFAKGGKKEACFHVVGGNEQLQSAPAIIVGEGYATAATIAEGVGFATVAAFDSGNLAAVAVALHERYPEKPIIIAGDDDLATLKKEGRNPGAEKAKEAARLVGGMAILPVFGPGEQSADNKDFTDFNDLAQRSALGRDAVARQVKAAVEHAILRSQERRQLAEQQTIPAEQQIQRKGHRRTLTM